MEKASAKAYLVAVLGMAFATVVLLAFRDRVNPTTVALALLLDVLFVATRWGMAPAVVASAVGMLAFNFFFLPPYHTFVIADPQNWVALAAFVITAVTAGQLSARARHRAKEAEAGRREIERLYTQLREAFDRASRAEALRQSEQMKAALLDAVTHDLRTPLTSIKVSVTNLLDELRGDRDVEPPVALAPEDRRELLEVIDEETDRLDRFVGNLVELARIEAGELELRRRPMSIGEVVSRALARAGRYRRTHTIVTSVADDLPSIHADGRALAEVVYTLVENAAKYSTPGTRIDLTARAAEGGGVLLTIEDEGRGIPTPLRERVFDRFYRFLPDPESSLERPTGTGLGLAIAREIVEAHGGRIWIGEGTRGRGTRVLLTLPATEGALAEAP